MITTTLNAIRSHKPCAPGWEKLLQSLGKTKADDEPLALVRILESNGLDDAIWCLRAVTGHDKEIRLFAIDCARRVEHLHPICKPTLDVAERYVNGEATERELKKAWETAAWAAWAATQAAAMAAVAAWEAASAVAALAAVARAGEEERKYQQGLFKKYFGEEDGECLSE